MRVVDSCLRGVRELSVILEGGRLVFVCKAGSLVLGRGKVWSQKGRDVVLW